MSVVAYELLDSMSGSITNSLEEGETREVNRRYLIGQCLGFNDAVAQIETYAPQYVDGDGAGIYWRRAKLNVQAVGNRYFDVTATYSTLLFKEGDPNDSPGDSGNFVPGSIAWDTTGHTEHRTQSRSTQSYGVNPPDFENAINVSGNSVNGIDVVSPNLRYSETWIMPVSVAMNCQYVEAVYTRTGTVNLNQFRCFKPGEALFMGARAQWQGDQPFVPVTFDFECRPNVDDFSVGTQANIPAFPKEGWQYVWFLYETDVNNARLVRHAIAAYKETLYEKKDWSAMQIVALPIAARRTPVRPPVAVMPQGWNN